MSRTRVGLVATMLAAGTAYAAAGDGVVLETQLLPIRVVTVASGLEHPWSLAFRQDRPDRHRRHLCAGQSVRHCPGRATGDLVLWAPQCAGRGAAPAHGPKGGDELNIARASGNYGWPLVTHGVAYSGAVIGVGSERPGITAPVRYWVPSIATSGLAFYTGGRLAPWQGNLFVGGLSGVLVRLQLDGDRVVHEERLLRELKERIRDVREGPGGYLYLLTDAARGRLLRLQPATARPAEGAVLK